MCVCCCGELVVIYNMYVHIHDNSYLAVVVEADLARFHALSLLQVPPPRVHHLDFLHLAALDRISLYRRKLEGSKNHALETNFYDAVCRQ